MIYKLYFTIFFFIIYFAGTRKEFIERDIVIASWKQSSLLSTMQSTLQSTTGTSCIHIKCSCLFKKTHYRKWTRRTSISGKRSFWKITQVNLFLFFFTFFFFFLNFNFSVISFQYFISILIFSWHKNKFNVLHYCNMYKFKDIMNQSILIILKINSFLFVLIFFWTIFIFYLKFNCLNIYW